MEKTLIEYVRDYLNEEIKRFDPALFEVEDIQDAVDHAIDAYAGGAR